MSDIFSKPLSDVGSEDGEGLQGVPEGLLFEVKGSLPAEDARKKPDSWMTAPEPGQTRNGPDDNAKEAIFRELVAFANTEGGWLVLGIEE